MTGRNATKTDGVFLGGLDSLAAALTEASLRIADIDDFTPDTFFWGNRVEPDDGLRVIDTFVLGEVTRITSYYWRGPSAVTADIASWVNDHGLLVAAALDDAIGETWRGGASPTPAGNDRRLFRAAFTDKTLAISSTALVYAEAMQIADADVERDIGGFAVETLLSISRVEIPVAGVYLCKLHVAVAGADNRTRCAARFVIGTGGVDRVEPSHGEIYARGQSPVLGGVIQDSFIELLEAGDLVGVQVALWGSGSALTLTGAESDIELVRIS